MWLLLEIIRYTYFINFVCLSSSSARRIFKIPSAILSDVIWKQWSFEITDSPINFTETCVTSQSILCQLMTDVQTGSDRVNPLAPGKFEWNFRYLILQIISVIDGWAISCELGLRWMSLDLTDDKSTLVQVMAWCRQATSHYLSQCWPRSLSPYGVTRPQLVNFAMSVIVCS